MILYGIKNCDTVRKALKWLATNDITVEYHDFRVLGINQELISTWVDSCGWESLLNKRSTSFRGLSDAEKADLDKEKAIALMLQHPTLIKRPVLVKESDSGHQRVLLGFNPPIYQEWLQQ